MRQALNTDTHALNQLGVWLATLIQFHCWLAHLASIFSLDVKSHGQIIHYRSTENVKKQASFSLFLDENI